jgi:histidinol-phosphate aminotransferase
VKGSFERNLKRIERLAHYTKPEKVEGSIKLDSNENFALDPEFVRSVAEEAARQVDLREYPLDQLDKLYLLLERYTGVRDRHIAAGGGSDQIIELILSTLGAKRATVFSPTFSYFINRCELHGIKVESVPLSQNFELNAKEFARSARRSDLAYICSPNNPTGNQFERKVVMDIVDSLDGRLVLIDEAYVDFADYSLSADIVERENVVVLRTLSKAFGLAGARVGYVIANEKFVRVFRSTIQSPYPISVLSLAIASGVLARTELVKKTIFAVRAERARLMETLSRYGGIKTFKSDANFVLIQTGSNCQAISKALVKNGVAVKLLGTVAGRRGCMRVTIGTREMNDMFIQSVEEALE